MINAPNPFNQYTFSPTHCHPLINTCINYRNTHSLSLRFNGHFPGGSRLAKGDGGSSNKWSNKMCKAPVKKVKMSPPTNQHATFYRPDALPVTQPTVSKH